MPTRRLIALTGLSGAAVLLALLLTHCAFYTPQAATSRTAVQLTSGASDNFYPVWSPDGRRLAYMSIRSGNWDLWLMNRDGADQHPLTAEPGRDMAPAWSPDGAMIAFTSNRDNVNNVAQLFVMAADGTGVRPVSRTPSIKQLLPAWSPRGEALAFLAEPMLERVHWQLRLLNLATTESRILAADAIAFAAPSWHPTDQTVAFVRAPAGREELWSIATDGGRLQPLLADKYNNSDPQWSPDGRRLAFSSDRSGSSEIWLLDAETHRLTQVTFHGARARHPHWSPDGRTMVFTSNRSGNDQIWVIPTPP